MLKFPLAGKKAANFCGSSVSQAMPARIAAAASKACGKFPVPEWQGICRAGAGNVSSRAVNLQVGQGMPLLRLVFMESDLSVDDAAPEHDKSRGGHEHQLVQPLHFWQPPTRG
jgi:hypothetical protein